MFKNDSKQVERRVVKMNQDNLKKEIINYMEENEKDSYLVNDLSDGLNYSSADQFKEVVKALASLERDKRVFLTKDGKFKLLEEEPDFVGRFSGTDRGFGFVNIPDFEKDIFIAPNDTNTALNGDTVRIEIKKEAEPWNDRSAEGKITEVVERGISTVVGEFHAYSDSEVGEYNMYGYVHPGERKLKHLTIQIGQDGLRPVDGQIILVDITKFSRYKNEDLEGVATKIIGHKDDPGIDILSIAYKHGIKPEFPSEVRDEVEEIPGEVLEEEIAGRRDLRGEKIVTIDGEDAKDLDDAIGIEKLSNGNYQLGVHIADVAHYVQDGTAIDKEAFERGTSSYLIDRVIPMLPQELSNGICSLHPDVDRLTLSADMEINQQGKVVNYEIYPSILRSYRRMSYEEVNRILMDEDPAMMDKHEDLVDNFKWMQELHDILEKKRINNGAITFDSTELKFEMDEDGTPTDIEIVERGVGERIIESFMLTANETVSEHFSKQDLPILYRVHEQPDEDKMQNFIEFASALGVRVQGQKDTISPKVLQGILDEVADEPYEQVVNMLMLRSMQKARYDVDPLGHYGLATEYYSHFTAPIRRYPDLILHRLIHYYQEVGKGKKAKNHWSNKLPEIAEETSLAERRAIDAEREVEDLKMAEYMLDKVGMEFDGLITSITNFGMFVQVEEAVEGLVHLSTMKDDYYEFNERGMLLVGEHTGKTFRIGESVRVQLANVDVDQYDIDFELVEEDSSNKKNQKNNKKNNNKNNHKNKKNKHTKNNKKKNGQKNHKNNKGKKKKKKKPKDHKKSRNVDFKIRDRETEKKRKKHKERPKDNRRR